MQPTFQTAQIDVSKIDIVSAAWERPPVNISNIVRCKLVGAEQ